MATLLAGAALCLLFPVAQGVTLAGNELASRPGDSLLQSWSGSLDRNSGGSKDTPVTRVVSLLKDMSKTVGSEMEEDESLWRKLRCWCNDNEWQKSVSIEKSEAKIGELQSSIESLTGSTAALRADIKELEAQFTADKQSLAEATALREKQLAEFHDMEKDDIQAIENLKAALAVLGKHHEAPPESTVEGGAIFKSQRDSWSLMQRGSSDRFPSKTMRSFDRFMSDNGIGEESAVVDSETSEAVPVGRQKFLQQTAANDANHGWSDEDAALVKLAVKSASAFVQSKQGMGYYPAYSSRSGEIMGVLKQLKEEMEGDLSEAQKTEQERGASFAALRAAKTEEIRSGEQRAEQKEDQLANQDNQLAEAKEDLGLEEASLSADQKFMKSVKEQCTDADKNYEERKKMWLQELQAISETISILQQDDARDAMSGTFSFLQVAHTSGRKSQLNHRRQAALTLRRAAKASQDPQLSILATSVELDAFTRVKKAIDDMIAMLRQQQEDEVKKSDWCKLELQGNEMSTAKEESHRSDLEAKIAKLESEIKALEVGIADAKAQIAQLHLDLQKATEDRKQENLDFQKVVADQTVTIEVLHKALDRLATYYDFVQTEARSHSHRQTPDVPQKEYKKSKGSTGVMEMIEKLIYDAKELMAGSKKSESDAQAAYEQLIADTNGSVEALQKSIVSKTKAKVDAQKDKHNTQDDLGESITELADLGKYNSELHVECDYVLKNFDVRQGGRAEEIEALQQAKQILNGADYK